MWAGLISLFQGRSLTLLRSPLPQRCGERRCDDMSYILKRLGIYDVRAATATASFEAIIQVVYSFSIWTETYALPERILRFFWPFFCFAAPFKFYVYYMIPAPVWSTNQTLAAKLFYLRCSRSYCIPLDAVPLLKSPHKPSPTSCLVLGRPQIPFLSPLLEANMFNTFSLLMWAIYFSPSNMCAISYPFWRNRIHTDWDKASHTKSFHDRRRE